MRNTLPETVTVGFVAPELLDGPYTVEEYDAAKNLIRRHQRVLTPGATDPFSGDWDGREGEDLAREYAFWAVTVPVDGSEWLATPRQPDVLVRLLDQLIERADKAGWAEVEWIVEELGWTDRDEMPDRQWTRARLTERIR